MEANKAENMIEHEAEIYSRPARTWFQTERQKKQVANRARDASLAGGKDEDDEDDEEAVGRSKPGNSTIISTSKDHIHISLEYGVCLQPFSLACKLVKVQEYLLSQSRELWTSYFGLKGKRFSCLECQPDLVR